jgi:hypothetical protein
MKSPIKNVELSFTCPQKWEAMVDVGNNKYCQNCKHLVVDFTKLTQSEYDDAIKNAPGRLCGLFKSSQMNPTLLKYVAAAAAITASVLVPTSCASDDPLSEKQKEPPVEQIIEEHETLFLGIMLVPDSTDNKADTTLLERPLDEDAYLNLKF